MPTEQVPTTHTQSESFSGNRNFLIGSAEHIHTQHLSQGHLDTQLDLDETPTETHTNTPTPAHS